jgi:hypothetical protein
LKNRGEDPHGADFYKKKQNCTGTKGNLQKKEKEGGVGQEEKLNNRTRKLNKKGEANYKASSHKQTASLSSTPRR